SIIGLRQAKTAVLLWNFDSKCADLGETLEIFRRNFAGAIDLVRIDMIAQIVFQLIQKVCAGSLVLLALCRIRINPVEIVATDKKIAGKTAAIIERIARRLRQLKRRALTFRHL